MTYSLEQMKDKKTLTEAVEQNQIEDETLSTYQKNSLKEDVNIITHHYNDHYVHYIEAVSNPGEMFELTRFGKNNGLCRSTY